MISKKIPMLGMWGVGKTSLVQRFVRSIYGEKYLATLGVKVDKKIVTVGDREVNLMLWDIAGAEDHFGVPGHYLKGSAGYLLVIDGTRRASLEAALDLIGVARENAGDIPFVAVVNKSDLEWEVTSEEITNALRQFQAPWFASSAKTGENVDEAFTMLAEKVL